jgi:hypothetical protein
VRKNSLLLTIVAVIIAVSLATVGFATPTDPEYPDPPGGGDPGGGGCTYCSQPQCGCAAPPLGYYLQYSCACAGGNCSRSCDYYPI